MNGLCQEVVDNQRFVTGRVILFQGSATPALISGDRNRLIQVLNNLLSNAVKYSPVSSSVNLSVHHDAQHVIIQVHDYGQGIEQDEICRIFDAFYRTAETQSGAARKVARSRQTHGRPRLTLPIQLYSG
jgi:two-component system phosphate regulon sensor histidine kinase PhoR